MRNPTSRRRAVAVAVTVLGLAAAGLVYAAWTATGGGSGYAKASSAQGLTTTDVSASTTGSLYPGADGNVLLKVTNPNPYPVRVTSVTGSGAVTSDAGHSTCGSDSGHPTGVTFTDQTGQTIDITGGASTQTTLGGAVHMSNASDDSCQGATFTIPVSLSGHSNAP